MLISNSKKFLAVFLHISFQNIKSASYIVTMNATQGLQISNIPYGMNFSRGQVIFEIEKPKSFRKNARKVYSKSIIAHVINLFTAPVI